jgi:hypothetical protein
MAERAHIDVYGVPDEFVEIGDLVRLDAWFTDDTGALVDPTTVAARVSVNGELTDFSVGAGMTKLEIGKYRLDVVPVTVAPHNIRWTATGTFVGAEERQLVVRSTVFPGA